MRVKSLNIFLTVILIMIWAAIVVIRPNHSRRGWVYMPSMTRSLTQEAQLENSAWPKLLPPMPVQGTIAQGQEPMVYKNTPQDAELAGLQLKNPFKPEAAILSRGSFIFMTYCVTCHGSTGLGDAPVTKAGFPAPPSLLGEKSRKMPDGKMFHIITFGQGNMPKYSAQIGPTDRWKVIHFVRQIQRDADAAAQQSKTSEVQK